MQPLTKDLILLMIAGAGTIFIYIWPMLYPYMSSLLHYQNPTLTMKQFFSLSVFLFIGIIVANQFLPKLYFLIGIKRVFYVIAAIQIFNFYSFLTFSSSIAIAFNFTIAGIINQMNNQTISFFLSEKYQGGFIYGSQALMGQNIFIITWPIIAAKIINPENEGMISYQNLLGEQDLIFKENIAHNLVRFMFLFGFVSTMLIFLGAYSLQDPQQAKPHLMSYIKALLNKNNQQLDILEQTFNTTKSLHRMNTSYSVDNVTFFSKNLTRGNQPEEELLEGETLNIEKESNQISRTLKFKGLVLFSSNIMGQIFYVIDNYKYFGLIIINNDKACTTAFSISAFFNLFAKYITPYIWSRFGFYGTYFILNTLMIVLYLLFFVSFKFPFMILIIIDLARFNVGLSTSLNQLSMFGLFNSHVALRLSKIYDSNYFIGFFIAILLNYFFVSEDNLALIFKTFLVIMIANLFFFTKYYKNYQQELNGEIY